MTEREEFGPTERDEFGPSLRRQRERCGLSLQEIAGRTKIGAAQFAAMERNDFSRWPAGIFGRSFLRAYAEVVGLDGEVVVKQFLRLFPCGDDGHVTQPSRAEQRAERDARAQTTTAIPAATPASSVPGSPTLARGLAGLAIDLLVVVSAGVASGLMFGRAAVWPALAVAAIAVFVVGDLLAGRSLGTRLLKPRAGPPAAAPARPVANRRPIETHQTRRRRHGPAGSAQTTHSRRKDRSRPRI